MTASTQLPSLSSPIKVGLVGFGWWGKTISRQISTSKWLSIVAVAEIDPHARSTMGSEVSLNGAAIYASPEELMAHKGLDAVILCTPHQQHAAQMVLAAENGLHVFCEKPLCLTLADAQ